MYSTQTCLKIISSWIANWPFPQSGLGLIRVRNVHDYRVTYFTNTLFYIGFESKLNKKFSLSFQNVNYGKACGSRSVHGYNSIMKYYASPFQVNHDSQKYTLEKLRRKFVWISIWIFGWITNWKSMLELHSK